jgi:dTDP-4-amino-4,6-dideoxygalactose transaminase
VHERIGTNSRLDALQAAVLRVKLKHLDAWTEARQALAARYTRELERLGLTEHVHPPFVAAHATRHVFNQYTVRVQERDALREHLAAGEVGTMVYYPIPLHLQPCFRDLGYETGDFPEAERAAREVLSLPLYPELAAAQQDQVIDGIARFYASR